MSRIFAIGGERSASVTDLAVPTRRYAAIGYADEPSVTVAFIDWVTANGLMTIGGLVLDEVNPTEIKESENNWIIDATWHAFRQKEPTPASESFEAAPPEFNFSFALASEKVFTPLQAQSVYKRTADSRPAPTIALIGDQGDGKPPSGVDLLLPEISFGEKRYLSQAYWTESTRNLFLRLIGKVNTTPFRSFDAGEVLLAGISGAARGRDDMELQFSYRVRENTTISIPGFPSFDKLGWQYLWPRHKLKAQGSSSELVVTQEIEFLVLSDVYLESVFTSLE